MQSANKIDFSLIADFRRTLFVLTLICCNSREIDEEFMCYERDRDLEIPRRGRIWMSLAYKRVKIIYETYNLFIEAKKFTDYNIQIYCIIKYIYLNTEII